MQIRAQSLADAQPISGYTGILCAVTLQAIQDVTECNGYSKGVDALQYLNSEDVQDMHDIIGIDIRRKWTFAEVRRLKRK